MVSSSLVVYFIENIKKDNYSALNVNSFPVRANLAEPQEIVFIYDAKIEKEIDRAAQLFSKLVIFN
jgi:hypothetical protein